MTAQEFKLIAVDRLGCENVRIKSKIINFVCDGIKTQKLCEMHDNGMTTAYVKRCNISIEEEGEPSILVYDNFQGAGTPVYESYKGDVQPCFQGMIADTMELKGKLKGQIVLYIAERLV